MRDRLRFWWRVLARGAGSLNSAAGWLGSIVLVLSVAAGVTVPLVFHVSHWITAVILAAVVVAIVLEGSYRAWSITDAERKAALESARAKSDEPARALVRIQEAHGQRDEDRRHEEMRPVLEARITPWTGRNFGKSHRLEVRIKSPWPLSTILAKFPCDPRTGYLPQWIEAPRTPNQLFRPGEWVNVGDTGYADVPDCDDELVINVKCHNELWECWDDTPVTVMLPKPPPAAVAAG